MAELVIFQVIMFGSLVNCTSWIVGKRNAILEGYIGYLKILLKTLAHQEILLLGDVDDGGGNILWHNTSKPTRLPKHGGLTIPNGEID
jgi:hypothetical protein